MNSNLNVMLEKSSNHHIIIRDKGWLEQGSEKFGVRLSSSGENFVKFDLSATYKTLQE
jgi:hypothetical protein